MRIIVVCDNRFALYRLKYAVAKTAPPGAQVKGFLHPLDSLHYARGHPVDVAFVDMDMKMPNMHGYALGRKLQEINGKVNLIIVSDSDLWATEAWSMRASNYLKKPIMLNQIEQTMTDLRYHPK